MSGDDAGADAEFGGTGDGRGDEEGLSQRGVLDRLIVGFRPVQTKIDPRVGGEFVDLRGEGLELEEGTQESRLLGSLARAGDC